MGSTSAADNNRVRLERCRRLFRRFTPLNRERIRLKDEKILSVEQSHNRLNDKSFCAEASGTSVIVEHRKKSKVSDGLGRDLRTPLVFFDEGLKIDQNVYRRDILDAVVVPWARRHFGRQQWTLQQDSAPAHRAKATQEWCQTNFPDFNTSAEWPPYSPYLNPIDCSFWSILEAQACAKPNKNL